jgi:hypothetical protein
MENEAPQSQEPVQSFVAPEFPVTWAVPAPPLPVPHLLPTTTPFSGGSNLISDISVPRIHPAIKVCVKIHFCFVVTEMTISNPVIIHSFPS